MDGLRFLPSASRPRLAASREPRQKNIGSPNPISTPNSAQIAERSFLSFLPDSSRLSILQ
jgi:hypothetical protein